jgi:Fuc2NAc and GlcNAc transferase
LLDWPNERSLHTRAVPRLGGLGIVLGASSTTAIALALAPVYDHHVFAWLVGALALGGIGLADDLRGLGVGTRLVAHFGVAAGFALFAGAPTKLVIASGLVVTLPAGLAVALWVFFIVGVLNIFNFMDGMDGLAALQAVGAALAVTTALSLGAHGLLAIVPLTLCGASHAFFIHNAPPAKIFMGDAGSTFIGFTFAAITLVAASDAEPLPILVVPLALAPFLLDGTATILRRLANAEQIWRAHRTHLYQRAATAGLSHHDVLVWYAVWIACSATGAVVVVQGGPLAPLLAVAVAVGGLIVTTVWVRRLEVTASKARTAPPTSASKTAP